MTGLKPKEPVRLASDRLISSTELDFGLQAGNVLGLQALGALADFEFNGLAFV